jgi:hypothetical protein
LGFAAKNAPVRFHAVGGVRRFLLARFRASSA